MLRDFTSSPRPFPMPSRIQPHIIASENKMQTDKQNKKSNRRVAGDLRRHDAWLMGCTVWCSVYDTWRIRNSGIDGIRWRCDFQSFTSSFISLSAILAARISVFWQKLSKSHVNSKIDYPFCRMRVSTRQVHVAAGFISVRVSLNDITEYSNERPFMVKKMKLLKPVSSKLTSFDDQSLSR